MTDNETEITKGGSKLVRNILILSFAVSSFAGTGVMIFKSLNPVPELSQKQMEKKAIQDVDIELKKDSIIARYKMMEKIESGEYREEISKECVRIQQKLKYCTRVDYWKVTCDYNNEKGVCEATFVVLISSSDNFKFDHRSTNKITGGYLYFANRTLNEDVCMIPDVISDGHLFYDPDTKRFLNRYSTKSLMGAKVSGNSKEWYLVTFSFSEINPETYNNNLLNTLIDFRRYVVKRELNENYL